MIVLPAPLPSLRADASDRFGGKRYLYPNGKPITRLRLVGQRDGQWHYAAVDDLSAVMPPVAASGIASGGKLGGRAL